MAAKELVNQILSDFKNRKSMGGYTPTNLKPSDHFHSNHQSGDALKLCDPKSKDYSQLKKLISRYA